MRLTPALVLDMWCAGIALGGGAVALWRVVGPGFLWLTTAVVAVFGLGAVVAGAGPVAVTAIVLAVAAGLLARRPVPAALAFAASGAAFMVAGLDDSGFLPIATGTLLLGGVTSEMMLGHWYLVDPRLPRWALQRLAVAGGAGLVLDAVVIAVEGGLSWDPVDAVIGWALIALVVMTGLLVAGVWLALREPAYTGVMAATGLSYLAVLTAFGVAALGRSLIEASASGVLSSVGILRPL
jgi:hypothetical protein